MNCAHPDFDKAIAMAGDSLEKIADRLSTSLGARDICIVGGAVRDTVLGCLTGRRSDIKDIDVMVSAYPTNIDKYTGLISVNKNTFGGTKLRTRDFGEIDIWHYDNNTHDSVVRYFDFNCNSLYYDHSARRLIASNQFHNFIKSDVLDFGANWGGRIESMVVRAIKFYILFNKNFGLDVCFGPHIMSHIMDMNGLSDEYVKYDICRRTQQNNRLRREILDTYNSLRGNKLR